MRWDKLMGMSFIDCIQNQCDIDKSMFLVDVVFNLVRMAFFI